jgi:hypothetical protein
MTVFTKPPLKPNLPQYKFALLLAENIVAPPVLFGLYLLSPIFKDISIGYRWAYILFFSLASYLSYKFQINRMKANESENQQWLPWWEQEVYKERRYDRNNREVSNKYFGYIFWRVWTLCFLIALAIEIPHIVI